VTEAVGEQRPLVSQVFCSALPVAYTSVAPSHWKAFASLVLEGAYEATLWTAVQNAQRGASNVVLLTSLGGGAFGNDDWIIAAMRRALEMMRERELDTKLAGRCRRWQRSSAEVAPGNQQIRRPLNDARGRQALTSNVHFRLGSFTTIWERLIPKNSPK
jgi:hypothetical protein